MRLAAGFWAVALTFLTLAAFTTVPSPLYGLYQARDGLSDFEVTVIYAADALGVIGALILAGHLSDWHGRRRLLIPAAGFTIVSAMVSSGCRSGSVRRRPAYLAELHAGSRPDAPGTRAELTATATNMGGPCGLAGGVSPRVTILGFAIAVAIGIVASAVKLLSGGEGRTLRPAAAEAG